jgi:hypothetical protein
LGDRAQIVPGHQVRQQTAQAGALIEDVLDPLAAVADRVLPAPGGSLRLIALLEEVRHDSREL